MSAQGPKPSSLYSKSQDGGGGAGATAVVMDLPLLSPARPTSTVMPVSKVVAAWHVSRRSRFDPAGT
jgi:hypothetical protein